MKLTQVLAASVCSCLIACAGFAAPIRVVDDRGKSISLPGPPRRIVSTAPSNTEILYALGLSSRVVGVSEYSNYPPEARRKPTIGSVSLSYERILSLKPDLVVAFWGLQKANVLRLERLGVRVLAIDPKNVADVLHAVSLVGAATGSGKQAARVVAAMTAKLNRAAAALKKAHGRPRALWVIATTPQILAAGPHTFMDDVLRRAGGVNVASDLPSQFPSLSQEAAIARRPEVLITSAPEWSRELAGRPAWRSVPAVKLRRFFSPPPDITERPGPRLPDAVLMLARFLHPEAFRP